MARVLVPLAEGFEEIEAVTIVDLLRRAEIEVVVAGLEDGPVTGSHAIPMIPDTGLDAAWPGDYDAVVLPGGGPGAVALEKDARVQNLLRAAHGEGKIVAAICAGPQALASAGVLESRRATSFPGILEARSLPTTTLTRNPVEIDGTVVTSRGPGTAMDFALALIALLRGSDIRDSIESKLQRPQ